MADDIRLNAGAGGDLLRAEDNDGRKYPVNKLAHGPLGTVLPVTRETPLPVTFNGQSAWSAFISGENLFEFEDPFQGELRYV